MLICLIATVIVSTVILASVPPVSRDAVTHHLAVPKLYIEHGGIYEIPHIKFSYYPMNLDLLYTIPLYFGNDIAPKYIHFIFALLTAWLIFSYLNQRLGRAYALLGALIFLSTPIIVKLSISAYVDLGLIFFSTAAVFFIIKWIEKSFNPKYLVISGVWCGLALGTKYNSLIIFLLCTLAIPFLYSRAALEKKSRSMNALKSAAVFFTVALIVSSPWMIRNIIWKQNPVYPLYQKVFNHPGPVKAVEEGKNITAPPRAERRLGHFSIRRIIHKEKWWETALIPVRIFLEGKDDDPKHFDGRLNPFLFILPFFLLLRPGKSRYPHQKNEINIWLAFSVLLVLYVFVSTDMRIRYISPVIPWLTILSVFGIHRQVTAGGSHPSRAVETISAGLAGIMVLCLILYNTAYICDLYRHVRPLGYISGRVTQDAYIERFLPEYPAVQYGNRHLPEDARILAIFLGNRRYYSDREIHFGIKFFKTSIKTAAVPEDILSDLTQKEFTHMIVGHNLFGWWVGNNFNQKEKADVAAFFGKYLTPLFSRNEYTVYRLANPRE